MSSLDMLYYSLAIGFLAVAAFGCYVLLELGKTLVEVRRILEEVEDITKDIDLAKEKVKIGVLDGVGAILRAFRR